MGRRLVSLSLLLVCALYTPVEIVSAETKHELTVSAAISLKNAFEEIGKLYEAKGGAKVLFNLGASGDLARQIEGGAPMDVFASAAQKDMDVLDNKGLIVQGSRFNIAANRVVLIVPAGSKTAIPASFEGLAAKEIRKIAVGNPKSVPAGRYAEEVLTYYKLQPSVKDKLIFTENVRQVLDYVVRGEVDAGIVYATDASTRVNEVRITASAPEESHKPVVYPIAVVKGTVDEASAKAFVALVVSPEGQRILAKYGFKKP